MEIAPLLAASSERVLQPRANMVALLGATGDTDGGVEAPLHSVTLCYTPSYIVT